MEKNNTVGYTKKEKLFVLLMLVILLAIISAGGLYIWKKFKPDSLENKISVMTIATEPKKEQPSEPPQEEKKPEEVSPVPDTSDKNATSPSEIDVKVLNGGAVVGTAVKIKEQLVASGYTKIEATNAKLAGYKGVKIYYKSGFQDQVQDIKEIMGKTYSLIETKEGIDEKEVVGDIVIIFGKP
jgi:cytoskeletal protein RodZ